MSVSRSENSRNNRDLFDIEHLTTFRYFIVWQFVPLARGWYSYYRIDSSSMTAVLCLTENIQKGVESLSISATALSQYLFWFLIMTEEMRTLDVKNVAKDNKKLMKNYELEIYSILSLKRRNARNGTEMYIRSIIRMVSWKIDWLLVQH